MLLLLLPLLPLPSPITLLNAGDDSPSQRWTSGLFPGGFFSPQKQGVRSLLNSLCLSANTGPDDPVVMQPCDGKPERQWTMEATGQLRSLLGGDNAGGSDKCMELKAIGLGKSPPQQLLSSRQVQTLMKKVAVYVVC
jgi:hypothetical protein